MFYRLILVMLAALALSACQSVMPPDGSSGPVWLDDPAYFSGRFDEIKQRTTWRYSAKVGLTAPELKEQANLVWDFQDQANSVRLFGPLGVGAIKLQFDQFGVVLSDSKARIYRGDNAEELLTRIVGWPIPIEALSSWIFVLPEKNAAFRYELDGNRRVKMIEQLGWLIEYSDYKEYAGGFMPRKIIATKRSSYKRELPEQQSNSIKNASRQNIIVKLVTKSWE